MRDRQHRRSSISALRIALSGYYGCGNTGDEAVLAGIVESFARRAGVGRADLTVFSADPTATTRDHGLRAVDRMDLGLLRRTLQESDLLLSGGGSLLQDTTSLRSLVYYLWIVRLALRSKTPVMFYAQGVGPLRRPVARLLTRLVADRVGHITVRDEESAALLRRIGVRKPPIEVTADPAFVLRPEEPERTARRLAEAGVPDDRPLIGIALRPWRPPEPAPAAYARLVERIAQEAGGHPLLLPMQPPGDVALAAQITGLVPGRASLLRAPLSPRAALGIIGALSGLVAMRLHALIFGAIGGVPLVALDYDPKVGQLMRLLGQSERAVGLADFSAEGVAVQMAAALAEGEPLRERLRASAQALAERALVNVDRALALCSPSA